MPQARRRVVRSQLNGTLQLLLRVPPREIVKPVDHSQRKVRLRQVRIQRDRPHCRRSCLCDSFPGSEIHPGQPCVTVREPRVGERIRGIQRESFLEEIDGLVRVVDG